MNHPAEDALVDVEPCSARCAQILTGREHLTLLVSPGNPYFSAARLAATFRWAARAVKKVDVLVSDLEMTVATYLARGRPEHHAYRRARADISQMAARIRRARDTVGRPYPRVSEFADWSGTAEYRRGLAYARRAIADPEYGPLLRAGTRAALMARMPEGWEPTPRQIDIGQVHSEKTLPFVINAVGILGVPETVTAYSRLTPDTRYFFTEDARFRAFPGQGYIALRIRP
ncbi:tRNA-dependent cyclodipeptide synthase [Nonomuraea typhae]|uniref:tRNA-dependent cyclodipeptide synthase n=1 Tax=Nonomuraea typhae TaxID=2603600 RepID=UPI0012FA0598|nr:tRNA-dependent cyclodipeptide synthase [Nonomuraea typhae]